MKSITLGGFGAKVNGSISFMCDFPETLGQCLTV